MISQIWILFTHFFTKILPCVRLIMFTQLRIFHLMLYLLPATGIYSRATVAREVGAVAGLQNLTINVDSSKFQNLLCLFGREDNIILGSCLGKQYMVASCRLPFFIHAWLHVDVKCKITWMGHVKDITWRWRWRCMGTSDDRWGFGSFCDPKQNWLPYRFALKSIKL